MSGSETESTIVHADGRVELRDTRRSSRPRRCYNEDLAPVAVAKRTWSTWDYAALWISMAHCIPTYTLASSMIASGMAWWQALLTILVGNLIVLAPILLNSHPGTKYGIPFPVFARAAYGTAGSNLPALMRAFVACGWFGINAWIGGHALQTFFTSLWPGWHDLLGVGRRRARTRSGSRSRCSGASTSSSSSAAWSCVRRRRAVGRAVRARDDRGPRVVGDRRARRARPDHGADARSRRRRTSRT